MKIPESVPYMERPIWSFFYTLFLLPLILVVLRFVSFKDRKIKESLAGKKEIWKRLDEQTLQRNFQVPLIWFHVASAGEYLQGEPLMEKFIRQGYDCAVTFSSVSGYEWCKRTQSNECDSAVRLKPVVAGYLPHDFPKVVRRLLTTLKPSAIVYVKYDLWPNLIWNAHAAGVPQFLISATLRSRSFRVTSAIGRSLYATIYSGLDGIFAVSEDDARRFRDCVPQHSNIQVTGDTRFDSVLTRKIHLPIPRLPFNIDDKFVFIAGSSWPAGEKRVFPGLSQALKKFADLMLIIVPHEPSEEHLIHAESFFHDFKIERFSRLQEEPIETPHVILVDRLGVLSSLYRIGNLAYVGGAFTKGVHNVMEPCVMGLPVIFGPRYDNSPESVDLLKKGLAFTIKHEEEFSELLFRLLRNRDFCSKLGNEAARVIGSQGGATAKCFALIQSVLP